MPDHPPDLPPPAAVPAADLVAARRSPWEAGAHRSLGRTVAIVAAMLAAIAAVAAVGHFGVDRLLEVVGRQPTSAELQARIAGCQREGDWACIEGGWTSWLKLHPDDANAMANLGIALNREDRHAEAVVQFKHAIEACEGAYDLFAYYADSLKHVGRVDEAIDWSYKSLSLVPRLVDVRGNLAKMLVAHHRPYEALSLLQSFDAATVATGRPAYFEGERIAIESGLAGQPAATPSLRLPSFERHFFAPVRLGNAHPAAFLIDTGATRMAIGQHLLAESGARYRVVQAQVTMVTADGRKVVAQAITIDVMQVGPFELRDVPAVVCADCQALLGQSALSRFDLQSTRTQGVEFLTLTPRMGA
jgi:clan AA aspartic protease (TIGR02281 family)